MLEAGPGGAGCLKRGVGGTVILLGKPGEDVSAPLRVHCQGPCANRDGSWGWGRGGAFIGQGWTPGLFASLGRGFSLHHSLGFSVTLVGGCHLVFTFSGTPHPRLSSRLV